MDTQQQEPELEQGSKQDLSGELHLPRINITGTQCIAVPTQSGTVAAPPVQQSADSSQNVFYFQDDLLLEEDDADLLGSPLAMPFQMSEEMPPLHAGSGKFAPTPTPPPAQQSTRQFPLLRVLILAAVIVIVILTGTMAFAQTSAPTLPAHPTNAPTGQATGQTPPPPGLNRPW